MIVHITRHGQVDQKTDHPVGDPYLSDLGQEQARLLGTRLKQMGFTGTVHSSPFYRTMETAQIVAEVCDTAVTPAAEMREYVIREGQMDRFEGATLETLLGIYSRLVDSDTFPYPWWTSEIETDEDIETRVAPLIERVTEVDEDVLLVGHGASVEGAHRVILKRITPEIEDHGGICWNCVLSSFRFDNGFAVIRVMDTDHLPPEAITANAKNREEYLREMEKGRQ